MATEEGEVSAFMIATKSEGCTGWTGTRRIWQGRKERTRDPLVLVARGEQLGGRYYGTGPARDLPPRQSRTVQTDELLGQASKGSIEYHLIRGTRTHDDEEVNDGAIWSCF